MTASQFNAVIFSSSATLVTSTNYNMLSSPLKMFLISIMISSQICSLFGDLVLGYLFEGFSDMSPNLASGFNCVVSRETDFASWLLFWPCCLCDLSFPTRDQTRALCGRARSPHQGIPQGTYCMVSVLLKLC